MNDLEIPKFLQRNQPEDKTMTHATTGKKTRNKIELPTTISLDGAHSFLSNMELSELILHRATWKQELADVPRKQLELKSIISEIKRKAR